MTTSNDRQLINDGVYATEQLEVLNPLFAEFQQRSIEKWLAANTPEERERQWMYVQALSELKSHFTNRVLSGQIAAHYPEHVTDGE